MLSSRRRVATAGFVSLAMVGLGVVTVLAALSARTPATEARVLASMPLTGADTDAEAPLFNLTAMAPGERYERCIVITANAAGSAVRFGVSDVSGALAPLLRVEVTTGGGTARSCSDFVPDAGVFYAGSLADLDSAGADGVPTGWRPQMGQRRTFRLAVEVVDDARAAGNQAAATLVWRLEGTGSPTTTPTTTTPTVPTIAPTTVPTTAPTTTPTTTPTTATPTAPTVAPTTAPPSTVPTGAPTTAQTSAPTSRPPAPATPSADEPSPAPSGLQSQPRDRRTMPGAALRPSASAPGPRTSQPATGGGAVPPSTGGTAVCPPSVTTQLADLAAGVARASGFPLLLLLLLLLFLALQDRLDRKDPKLAEAPLFGAPDQAVPPSGTTPWRI